ncbi:MAG: AarF/ABC1/UbiB kinase family protein, partial [Microcystis aeruginosa Ma_AC_P_19900807_S299]
MSRHQDSQTDRKREETQFTPYSAEAIAQQYRYKPWQLFGRTFVIIWSLGLFLLSLLWDKWTKQEEANKY